MEEVGREEVERSGMEWSGVGALFDDHVQNSEDSISTLEASFSREGVRHPEIALNFP